MIYVCNCNVIFSNNCSSSSLHTIIMSERIAKKHESFHDTKHGDDSDNDSRHHRDSKKKSKQLPSRHGESSRKQQHRHSKSSSNGHEHSSDGDSDSDNDHDDDNDEENSRRRQRRHRKKHKSDRKHKKHSKSQSRSSGDRKRRKDSKRHCKNRDKDDDDHDLSKNSSDFGGSSDNDDDHYDRSDDDSRRRKRKRKESKKEYKKKSRKRHKEEKKKKSTTILTGTDGDNQNGASNQHHHLQQHLLTQALCQLFTTRPVFSQELPILLIRLAGGSTLDLRQMNDASAATALERVLVQLQPFGVQQQQQQQQGEWSFQTSQHQMPTMGRSQDERVLLRVIRSMLDDVGVTMKAIAEYEAKAAASMELEESNTSELKDGGPNQHSDDELDRIKDLTSKMVLTHQGEDSELGMQLAELCQSIAQGESVLIDAIPNEALKTALEEIFVACGLVKSEMVDDDDDDEGNNEVTEQDVEKQPLMGYGMPEEEEEGQESVDIVPIRLAAVIESCRNPKRRVRGPQRPTMEEVSAKYPNSDDDEGPVLPGEAARLRAHRPELPLHVIKDQAEQRQLELKAVAAGIEVPTQINGREEWMVVPGKYDFLSNIKSGQPIKSRGFQNKKTRGGDNATTDERPMHPAIQAEMDAIKKAHEEARGPSLIDQHRAKKQQEKAEAASKKEEWNWKRDRDLDAGRRVDKDALHMVLGGAADNLKTKFHSGQH